MFQDYSRHIPKIMFGMGYVSLLTKCLHIVEGMFTSPSRVVKTGMVSLS
jgi:hypothetical protein